MIETLLAKLLIPLVLMLIVSGAGIAVLVVDWMREREAERPREKDLEMPPPVVTPPRPARAPTSRASEDQDQDTLVVRPFSGPRDTLDGSTAAPRPPAPPPEPPPFRTSRDDSNGPTDPPTVPVMPTRAQREAAQREAAPSSPAAATPRRPRLSPTGSNIVLNQPANPDDFDALPGKLEVIYGNFSPNDPRDIGLYRSRDDEGAARYIFSKTAGEGLYHVQLNHYTVTPLVQAELTLSPDGRHVLANTVPAEEMDRYQTRINGVPMSVGECRALASGDIISMGIYRLKLTL